MREIFHSPTRLNTQDDPAREMVSRAVSAACADLMRDSIEFHDDEAADDSSEKDKENASLNHTTDESPSLSMLELKLDEFVQTSANLQMQQAQRYESRSEESIAAEHSASQKREFYRRLRKATLMYQQRKLAVQALQARVERELQFLTATAKDLEKRVSLASHFHSSRLISYALCLGDAFR